jgi:hypothetical protein
MAVSSDRHFKPPRRHSRSVRSLGHFFHRRGSEPELRDFTHLHFEDFRLFVDLSTATWGLTSRRPRRGVEALGLLRYRSKRPHSCTTPSGQRHRLSGATIEVRRNRNDGNTPGELPDKGEDVGGVH